MSAIGSYLRLVSRRLFRSPLFTLISGLTLALGIGATTAIFAVVQGVLLTPLPFDEPERLVGVWHQAPGLGFERLNQSPALHFTYQEANTAFDEIGMYDAARVTVTGLAEPERLLAMRLTEGTLRLLGVRPALGRIFNAEDDAYGSPETVMLSHGYWQRRLGGETDVLGKTITMDGRPREVIGVLPEHFRFLTWRPALYLPFQFDLSKLFIGNFSYQGVARLKDGVTVEDANRDLERMLPIAAEKFPFPSGLSMEMVQNARFGPDVHPLIEDVVGDIGTTLWLLLGAVSIVLLVACANVANLFLVRAEGRQRELALRSALGADRLRIARELLGESVMLGALGGFFGLGVAYGAIRVLVAVAPETLPRLESIEIDATVLTVALALSVASGVFFGLVPVLKYGRGNVASALKEGGRASSDGPDRQRARGTLVVAQIALALVLLVGAGLMLRSFHALRGVHPGFVAPEDVLTFRLSISEVQVPEGDDVPRMHERILHAIEDLPGVTSIGLSSSVTMDRWDSSDPVFVEEFPTESDELPPIRRHKWISPGYHETMGNPVLAGRSLTWDDVRLKSPVVVVTESFALEYWDSASEALGKRVRPNPKDRWRTIVGVVGNVHDDGVDQDVTDVMYWPMSANDFWEELDFAQRTMAYVVRTERAGDPSFLPQVRETIWSVAPDVPVASVRMLDEILAESMNRTWFTLIMLGIASAVALLIGAVGLYGVIAYGVSQRTREIGVRMTLGAERRDVSGLFVRKAAGLAALGIAVGFGGAFVLTRSMHSLLFGVSAADPATYVVVSGALLGVALLASYLPARRAGSLDPTQALRWE